MNNLQKALAQLIALARSMTPQARLVAGLVLALIALSAAYLFNVGVSADSVYLFGDEPVAPNQINSMQAAFAKAGLNEATIEGNHIRVPRAERSKYMAALADAGALPHNFGDTLRKMLETSTLLIGKKKQEEMIKLGTQDELSRIVSKMNGIEWATVMYNAQPPSWPNKKHEVRASVTVKLKGTGGLTRAQVQQIRSAVGPPIGAMPQEVTVIDTQGPTYPAGTDESSHAPGHDLYASAQHEYERDYKEKIQTALSFVPGAVVTVNVELNSEVEDSAESVKIDAKSGTVDRHDDRNRPQAPAVLGNLPRLELGGFNSPATIDLSNTGGYETRHIKRAGLTPKRVTVSVAVPRGYFEQQWRLRHGADADAQPDLVQLAKIEAEIRGDLKRHVLQVLPVPDAQQSESDSWVTVTEFSQPPPEIVQPSQSDQALAWVNEHSGLVVAAVSCFLGLLMLRSIVRSAVRATAPECAATRHDEVDEPHELPEPPAYSRHRRRRSPHGSALREELSDIVRDDPNAAAGVLRSWIGSAN